MPDSQQSSAARRLFLPLPTDRLAERIARGITGLALFGLGISPFLPGWLGADPSLRANSTAYFAIWSTALPFTMAMGMYASILRAAGYALTASLISVLVCVLDAIFNFFLINPTRTLWGITVWGAGLGVPGV